MTTLAQIFLEDRTPTQYDTWPLTRLAPYGMYDDAPLTHKFVFDESLGNRRFSMIQNKQLTSEILLTTTRMLAPSVWIEWVHSHDDRPDHKTRYGCLFEEPCKSTEGLPVELRVDDHGIAFTIIASSEGGRTQLLFTGSVNALPIPVINDHMVRIISSHFEPGRDSVGDVEQQRGIFSLLFCDALFGMFLLGHPKTIVKQKIVPSEKLQKARAKRQKPRLIEYDRISITIDGPVYRRHSADSVTTPQEGSSKRKYHEVCAHFKMVHTLEGPKSVFVDSYTRGDPALGVSLRTKKVKII